MEEKHIKAKKARVNEDIRVPEVRVVDENSNQLGILPIQEALNRARSMNLDLVEIAPNSDPPVCKIMDFGRFLFGEKKKKTAAKKKQKRVQVKQIRIRPGIEEGDYQVKLRNLMRFLKHGDRVEINLRFRGREASHKDIGMAVLQRMQNDVQDVADIEQEPKFEGRMMKMVLVSKKPK